MRKFDSFDTIIGWSKPIRDAAYSPCFVWVSAAQASEVAKEISPTVPMSRGIQLQSGQWVESGHVIWSATT